ncbi:MAG: hypothetical protein ACFNKE_04460, partial [Neisseria elongata]
APDVPAGAVSFSNQDAGPASTLVLFDTTGDYAKLGEHDHRDAMTIAISLVEQELGGRVV